MAHSISWTGGGSHMAGYLVSLPFDFDSSKRLRLLPQKAMAIVQLASGQSEMAVFSSYTNTLPQKRATFAIKDEDGKGLLSLADFQPAGTDSWESTDLGQSTWVLSGGKTSTCKITYTGKIEEFPYFNDTKSERFYWGGELSSEDSKTLGNLSYARCGHDLVVKAVKKMMAFGPTGFGGCGSVFNWIASVNGKWMIEDKVNSKPNAKGFIHDPGKILPRLVLKDLRRTSNEAVSFFGKDAGGRSQVKDAQGAVYLFQGSVSKLKPRSLWQLIKRNSETESTDLRADMAMQDALAEMERTCKDSVQPSNAKLLEIDETLFEGIALWDLKPRKGDKGSGVSPLFL